MSAVFHETDGIAYLTSSLLDSFGIPHLFAGRHCGVSDGVFDSLNCSLDRKNSDGKSDGAENVFENCKRTAALLNVSISELAMMRQIHSAKIQVPSSPLDKCISRPELFSECDGLLLTADSSIRAVGIKTADCVPIFLYDVDRGVACGLHAGWRGSVANIVGKAVARIKEQNPTAQIKAAIGPCIGACCYEVSEEVYGACPTLSSEEQKEVFPIAYLKNGEKKFRLELTALNRILLSHAGIPDESIDCLSVCTCCRNDFFFSHRAQGGFSGTQLSLLKVL